MWEVVLRMREHGLCRHLLTLQAITCACCELQYRRFKVIITWLHWILDGPDLVPMWGTSQHLLGPWEHTAVAKLVETGGHVGDIILILPTDRAGSFWWHLYRPGLCSECRRVRLRSYSSRRCCIGQKVSQTAKRKRERGCSHSLSPGQWAKKCLTFVLLNSDLIMLQLFDFSESSACATVKVHEAMLQSMTGFCFLTN